MLNDTSTHTCTTSGTYAYNGFQPGAASFPAVGETYTDPTFGAAVTTGSVVIRLTDIGTGNAAGWQHYSFHNINVGNTLCFVVDNGLNLVYVSSGAVAYSSRPVGDYATEIRWDMVSSDIYYYTSGTNLVQYSVSSQVSSVKKNFGATLSTQGGSVNYQSADGRYFCVNYGTSTRVWDSSTDTIYTGGITPAGGGGWMGMTADGKYVYGGGYPSTTLGDKFYAFPIYHSSQTVSTVGIMCWDLCGDHGNAFVGSNGSTYLATFACNSNNPGIYIVTMDTDREAMNEAQQQADAAVYVPIDWDDQESMHISAISVGDNRGWVFASPENNTDLYNGDQSSWFPYTQEIIGINVSSGEVRRFAHHRSRNLGDAGGDPYQQQPRISCSPDGGFIMWASNFNSSTHTVGYSDYYGIANPLGAAEEGGGGEESVYGSQLGGMG